MFLAGGGRPRGSALAAADGSHAFVRVTVRGLTVPRGAPRLDAWRRRRSDGDREGESRRRGRGPARRGRRRPGVGERAPAGATPPGPLGPRPGPRRAPPRRGETRPGVRSRPDRAGAARPPTKLERARREAGPRGARAPVRAPWAGRGGSARATDGTYLVDPASSHMLVSKAKPCTCKHRPPHGEAANGSLDRLQFIRSYTVTWITVVILELIHATSAPTCLAGRGEFIRSKPTGPRGPSPLVTQDNFGLIARPWRRRRIFQVSALSSSVCRCPAYIAGDG